MKIYRHYINGAFVAALSGETFDTADPYSGKVWAKIARGSAPDIAATVTAAKDAADGECVTYSASHRDKLLFALI